MAGRKPLGIADYLFNEARYAVRDIRQKVFEEAWFGRVVTPNTNERSHDVSNSGQRYFEEAWGRRVVRTESITEVFKARDGNAPAKDFFEEAWGRGRRPDHEQEKPQHEQEIDR